MSRFNRELQLTLQAAMREAVRRRHAYLTVEHLLFALCHDERGAEVLRHSGANVRKLKTEASTSSTKRSRASRARSRSRPARRSRSTA
jgi:ATP-dependent Clp protease ATP-binding subunit ClpA